jgi:uncharacterized SAM-binding protein YcdF (DUF218 family)
MISYRMTKLLTQLAYPLCVGLLLSLIGLILLWRGRTRAARACLVAGIAGVWVPSLPVVGFHLNSPLELRYAPVQPADAPSADAIVLLGGAISPPHPPLHWMNLNESVDRLVHAARLYRAGKAPLIVVSGGGGHRQGQQRPADAMADLLVEWGLPREALLLERRSRNTWENALYTKELLDARGIHRVLVVTSAKHMWRSLAVFRTLGLDAIPAGTDYSGNRIDYASPMAWLPDAGALHGSSGALKEYLGIFVYWLRGQIRWDALFEPPTRR